MEVHILIAAHRAILRAGLRSIFSSDQRVAEIHEVANTEELIKYLETHTPDLVIIHQTLITNLNILPRDHFVIITSKPDKSMFLAALEHGGRGYLLEDASAEALLMSSILSAETFIFDRVLTTWIIEHISSSFQLPIQDEALTAREQEVLNLRSRGFSNLAIAEKLNISENTVKSHFLHISRKQRIKHKQNIDTSEPEE